MCVTLNPVESIPATICLVRVSMMNEEIIFPSNPLLTLPANFCNVEKCGIRDNCRNNLKGNGFQSATLQKHSITLTFILSYCN
jgi:hypothetical protein